MTSSSIFKELPLVLQNELAVGNVRDQVAQLFVEARDDVYRYLLTLGLFPPQAQEATQEVFLRLYVVLKKGEDIQNHRAWVFRVAHNHGLKVRQRQKDMPPFDPVMEATIADPCKNAEKQMIERERLVQLQEAIKSLSEQQRRCLFLRMEGLRYNEIGETLGISAPTVGEFLRRALARLKKVIHE